MNAYFRAVLFWHVKLNVWVFSLLQELYEKYKPNGSTRETQDFI